ncbi:MAG: Zn-dependent protease with chaperone function, partial [Myxococcota bacterium]
MSLFKQLLTDLKDAAEEISTTLAADLSDARSVVGGEVGEAAEEINAALLARQGGWDTEITDHHQSLDAAVHEALVSKLTPQAGAALVRVEGVLARLQQARPDQPPVSAVVLKWDAPNAMVLFSHRVYVSTALLDALPSDDALAFVLGHELTHIDRDD